MKFMYMFYEDREICFFKTRVELESFLQDLAIDEEVDVQDVVIYNLETGKEMIVEKMVSYSLSDAPEEEIGND
jgi:hypothetical protein